MPAERGRRPEPTTLVCLHHAGGSATTFHGWADRLGPDVEVVAPNLPGRGDRPDRPVPPGVDDAVDDLLHALGGRLDRPWAVFGHSMGALMGYELALRVVAAGGPAPRWMFVCGSRAPQAYGSERWHRIGDDELAGAVGRWSGGVVDGDEPLVRRNLALVRADLRLCETYRWHPRPRLHVPMTVFSSPTDPVAPPASARGWSDVTSGSALTVLVEGGHFAPRRPDVRDRILRRIAADLRERTRRRPVHAVGSPVPAAPRLPDRPSVPSFAEEAS